MTAPNSLYIPGEGRLHRLHPLTKLTFTLASAVVIFGAPGGWLPAAAPGLLALCFLWRAGLAAAVLQKIFRLLAPLTVVLLLVHGFFSPLNRTVLFSLGPLSAGQEGAAYAALILLRLAAVLAASLLTVVTTHPARLVQALFEAGLPYGLAYLLGSPLLLLPQIAGRVKAIQAAQQARGLETEGGLLQRARAFFPLAAPLIFSTLLDVEERALALEVRGFSAPTPKTSLYQLVDTPRQRAARWSMLLLAGLLLAAGFWWRVHAGA
ncbi:MAG: energy-coupling factor transporter transmembrane component T family protein [Chloroflexota bacterium]